MLTTNATVILHQTLGGQMFQQSLPLTIQQEGLCSKHRNHHLRLDPHLPLLRLQISSQTILKILLRAVHSLSILLQHCSPRLMKLPPNI